MGAAAVRRLGVIRVAGKATSHDRFWAVSAWSLRALRLAPSRLPPPVRGGGHGGPREPKPKPRSKCRPSPSPVRQTTDPIQGQATVPRTGTGVGSQQQYEHRCGRPGAGAIAAPAQSRPSLRPQPGIVANLHRQGREHGRGNDCAGSHTPQTRIGDPTLVAGRQHHGRRRHRRRRRVPADQQRRWPSPAGQWSRCRSGPGPGSGPGRHHGWLAQAAAAVVPAADDPGPGRCRPADGPDTSAAAGGPPKAPSPPRRSGVRRKNLNIHVHLASERHTYPHGGPV